MDIILAAKLNGAVTVEQFAHIFSSVLVENIDNLLFNSAKKINWAKKKPRTLARTINGGKDQKQLEKYIIEEPIHELEYLQKIWTKKNSNIVCL